MNLLHLGSGSITMYIGFCTGPGKNKYTCAKWIRLFKNHTVKYEFSYSTLEVGSLHSWIKQILRACHTRWALRRQMEHEAFDCTFHKVKAISWTTFLKQKKSRPIPIKLIHTPCMDTHFLHLKLFNPIPQYHWECKLAIVCKASYTR